MTRLKVAELTSGVGALVLGVGLGALFPQWFAPAAGVIALAGVVAHAFGMWDKHRMEGQAHAPSEPWVTVLYWSAALGELLDAIAIDAICAWGRHRAQRNDRALSPVFLKEPDDRVDDHRGQVPVP